MHRRSFLFQLALGSSILFTPSRLMSQNQKIIFHKDPYLTFTYLFIDLTKGSGLYNILDNINPTFYFSKLLQEPLISEDEKTFLLNGVKWLNESAQEAYKKSYYQLTPTQREVLLQKIVQIRWGDNWLWSVMSYFFEAMLGDPVYGGNIDQQGWHYLGLESGYPRTRKAYYDL